MAEIGLDCFVRCDTCAAFYHCECYNQPAHITAVKTCGACATDGYDSTPYPSTICAALVKKKEDLRSPVWNAYKKEASSQRVLLAGTAAYARGAVNLNPKAEVGVVNSFSAPLKSAFNDLQTKLL
jgi:hypothetical protein